MMANSVVKIKIPSKFQLIGKVYSYKYQYYKFILEEALKLKPKPFREMECVPCTEMEWTKVVIKMKRLMGASHEIWKSCDAIIFGDDQYIGDVDYLKKVLLTVRFPDFNMLARCAFHNVLREDLLNDKRIVFIVIYLNSHMLGSMVFRLHADVMPLTCNVFAYRCVTRDSKHSYYGTVIHRLVKSSFLQCGAYKLKDINLPLEACPISHNQRGTLSMCNDGMYKKHGNTTQFLVTLNGDARWMDGKYVAFGHLIHGDGVLAQLERLETHYEAIKDEVTIADCGEITLDADGALKQVALGVLDNYVSEICKVPLGGNIAITEQLANKMTGFMRDYYARMGDSPRRRSEELAQYKIAKDGDASQRYEPTYEHVEVVKMLLYELLQVLIGTELASGNEKCKYMMVACNELVCNLTQNTLSTHSHNKGGDPIANLIAWLDKCTPSNYPLTSERLLAENDILAHDIADAFTELVMRVTEVADESQDEEG